jgi:hypothetical protein
VVEESCYATKRGSPQSGHEGDDAIVIFSVARVRRVQESAAYDRYKFMEKFDAWTEVLSLEVKVPRFFSLRGASRCPGTDISPSFGSQRLKCSVTSCCNLGVPNLVDCFLQGGPRARPGRGFRSDSG